MGNGASMQAQTALNSEAAKPLDARDVTNLEYAKIELINARKQAQFYRNQSLPKYQIDTTGDVVTGGVSDSEIEEIIQSTVPTLPTHQVPEGALPLPLTGLPDGWTMDQWVAYGHIWWEQNGP